MCKTVLMMVCGDSKTYFQQWNLRLTSTNIKKYNIVISILIQQLNILLVKIFNYEKFYLQMSKVTPEN